MQAVEEFTGAFPRSDDAIVTMTNPPRVAAIGEKRTSASCDVGARGSSNPESYLPGVKLYDLLFLEELRKVFAFRQGDDFA